LEGSTVQQISLGIFILSMFGLGKFLRAWSNFLGHLRVIRESQKRFEETPEMEESQ
jgi:hypothetical protein